MIIVNFRSNSKLIFKKSTYLLILTISALHVLNYLNYSMLAGSLNTPIVRAALLSTVFVWVLFTKFNAVFSYHLRVNYDLYAFSVLALCSSLYSEQVDQTLLYSAWLFIAIYLALELSSRLSKLQDIQFVLLAVIFPAVVVSGLANLIVGAEVSDTGRIFGALGTRHVDAALSLDVILVFLAVRSVQTSSFRLKGLRGTLLAIVLLYSVYVAIFSLTRSIWLGALLGLLLFALRNRRNIKKSLRNATVLGVVLASLIVFFDFEIFVPDSVEKRVELTLERYKSGEIDSRIVRFKRGYELITEQPILGYGYNSGLKAHNSYLNIVIDTGLLGFVILFVAFFRSVAILMKSGNRCVMFFLIGAGGLVLHAGFESQNTPGQGNFVPLLMWFALTRSQYVLNLAKAKNVLGVKGNRSVTTMSGPSSIVGHENS